jgi:hypothetical protein
MAALAALVLSLAACGNDEDDTAARPASSSSPSRVERQIRQACERVIAVTAATKVQGYGSETDYFIVVCDNGDVRRVEVG